MEQYNYPIQIREPYEIEVKNFLFWIFGKMCIVLQKFETFLHYEQNFKRFVLYIFEDICLKKPYIKY